MTTALMVKKSIGELSTETLKLQEFLSNQAPGTLLSYVEIEHETGVTMSLEGKSRLRSALNGLKREYTTVRGQGIRLADANTAMPIISTRIRRIDSSVKRADKSHRRLQQQFLHEMTPQQQKQMLFAGAVFGAIRLAAEQGRQIQKKLPPAQSTVSIAVPLLN